MALGFPGEDRVVAWFGEWPAFHDAEVLELHLDPKGVSDLRVKTWRVTDQVDSSGTYVQDKHCVVIFKLFGVADLKLASFSSPNVLSGLGISPCEKGFRVTLNATVGLGGSIEARNVEVELVPLARSK